MAADLGDLDAAGVLRRAEAVVLERRAAIVEDLELCLAWADLHPVLPPEPDHPVLHLDGRPKLVRLGGEGTPEVVDLCLHELAIARGVHHLTARAAVADALDLRHRLPRCWAAVRELACEAWLVRKIAGLSRHLDPDQAGLVDAAVAPALRSQAPGRVLTIAEAAIIHADPETHRERCRERDRKRFVHVGRSREEDGLRSLYARLGAGDAAWIDALLDHVADLLLTDPGLRSFHHPDLPEEVTKDELRAVALTWLARPRDLLDLLPHLLDDEPDDVCGGRAARSASDEGVETPAPAQGSDQPGDHGAGDHEAGDQPAPSARPLVRRPAPGRKATLYAHLDADALSEALTGGAGIAVVEQLGAMLLTQLADLLRHAHVTLTPVIDLNTTSIRDGYTHGDVMAERAHLRIRGETWPHSASQTRRMDRDHPDPYQRGGPPGQTSETNLALLTRSPHRAKTFLGYTCHQLDHHTWLFRTPHGLWRLVDHTGTHHIPHDEATTLIHRRDIDHRIDQLLDRITHAHEHDPGP
ncbi:MAG TPA: DUF222 domain-containing protein [Acidimicrobiales bacterium]